MIQPTPGRVVWYHPAAGDTGIAINDPSQPCAAMIAYVWHAHMVNLTVSDHNGQAQSRTSVRLLQDGEKPMPGTAYCEWMPFQKGQAAKTEALERQVGAGNDTKAGATS